MRSCFLLLAAACVLYTPARGEDWPEFRGPTGQGISRTTGLPVEWGANRNVAWKRAIPGRGWSSPVVGGGRVYLTTAVPVDDSTTLDQSLRVLCLDAVTGKVRWERQVFRLDGDKAPPIHGKNSHASPTPLLHGDRLYVHFGHQGTACLGLDGQVLWRNTSIHYAPVHGSGGSPILAGKRLVFSCDGADERFLVALNCDTGRLLWKTDRGGEAVKKFSFSTPLLITVNGRQQIISPGSNMVGAYDPETGREIWHVDYEGYSVVPRPAYGQGLVFVSTGFEAPVLLAIRPDGHGDVTATHVAGKTRRGAPLTPSPLVVGRDLYLVADNGLASCLDAHTGRVHWQQRVPGNYSASPLYADGRVYLQSEEGTGVVLKAGHRFQELARSALDEPSLASCAAAGGALFIRTENHLYCVRRP
jgi:outer membrane protein assembly factor BamB